MHASDHSTLARRAVHDVARHPRTAHGRVAPMLPVFNMVDCRRKQPLAALAVHPDWPVVLSASGLDAMATIPPAVRNVSAQ